MVEIFRHVSQSETYFLRYEKEITMEDYNFTSDYFYTANKPLSKLNFVVEFSSSAIIEDQKFVLASAHLMQKTSLTVQELIIFGLYGTHYKMFSSFLNLANNKVKRYKIFENREEYELYIHHPIAKLFYPIRQLSMNFA